MDRHRPPRLNAYTYRCGSAQPTSTPELDISRSSEKVPVQGIPAAVRADDLGRDDGVSVELRVILPGRHLRKHRHREPVLDIGEHARRVHPDTCGGVRLDVVEHDPDGEVVRRLDARIAGQAPPCRDRLRRRDEGPLTANPSRACARGGSRTRMLPEEPRGLSPLRIPIPPPGRVESDMEATPDGVRNRQVGCRRVTGGRGRR